MRRPQLQPDNLSNELPYIGLARFNEAKETILFTINVSAANPQRILGVLDRHGPAPIVSVGLATNEASRRQSRAKSISQSLPSPPRIVLSFLWQRRKYTESECKVRAQRCHPTPDVHLRAPNAAVRCNALLG